MRRLVFALLLAMMSSLQAAQDGSAEEWLQRMGIAASALSYQGTLVYSHDGELVTFRLTHVRDGDHEWEHLVQLDGQANEVLRGGSDLIYKSAAGASTRLQIQPAASLRPDTSSAALARSRESYRFALKAGERIAGRDAVQVLVTPLQPDRYGHVFFLERSSGLLLRSLLLDADGSVLETLGFSSLTVDPDVGRAEYLGARRASKAGAIPAAAASAALAARWRLQAPAGFVAEPEGWRARQMNGARVEVVTYGDGLSSFSVFSEPLVGKMPRTGQSRRGATRMASRVLGEGPERWLLTVVGELPMTTVQRIADSIVPLRQ
ncbi:MAG: MucB/RseB C-terminal domain-containing protein [Pedobacter sp.]|nr:MucB/RseB C-terminal domain-containing protein [Pedobacter sp.]